MTNSLVQVPAALLLSPDLPATAKLAWMVARLRFAATQTGAPKPPVTAALTRPAMLKSMTQLSAAGWDPDRYQHGGATVAVPASLLTDRKLGIHARVLYGILLLTPEFQHPCGRFTYAGLAQLANASPNTIMKAVRELVGAEWLQVGRANRLAPIHFQLSFPGFDRQRTLLAVVQKRLERARFFGEQLMREYLSLLVDSADYEDDAPLGFLVNPRTHEQLRFDRYYPPNVAWEFNGPQHYHATERFTEEDVARQQERDYLKAGICVTRGITLVVVRPADLTLAGMREKIGTLLPLRDLAGLGLVADYLEAESQGYRRRTTWL